MRKFAGVVVLLFMCISVVVLQNDSDSEASDSEEGEFVTDEVVRALAEKCRTPEATDGDLEDAINEEEHQSHESKCITACMLREFDIISEDGKLNYEGTKLLFEAAASDEETLKKKFAIIEKCKSVEDNDICEMAHKLNTCFNKESQALGMEKTS